MREVSSGLSNSSIQFPPIFPSATTAQLASGYLSPHSLIVSMLVVASSGQLLSRAILDRGRKGITGRFLAMSGMAMSSKKLTVEPQVLYHALWRGRQALFNRLAFTVLRKLERYFFRLCRCCCGLCGNCRCCGLRSWLVYLANKARWRCRWCDSRRYG